MYRISLVRSPFPEGVKLFTLPAGLTVAAQVNEAPAGVDTKLIVGEPPEQIPSVVVGLETEGTVRISAVMGVLNKLLQDPITETASA